MDNPQILAAAQQYGTPTFVFDEVMLASRMREIKSIVGKNVRLCYSIKANPFLLPAMSKLTEKLEVCSPGEMEICMDCKVAPETVLVSGVNKTLQDILDAVDYGVRDFTAESPLHVQLLEEAAALRGVTLQVLLRLTAGTQFGMDESDLRAAIERRETTPHLDIVGIHYFAGTQRKKLTEQRKEIAEIIALCDALKAEYGFEVKKLEYGPGLYYPYFIHEDSTDTLVPIRELAPDLIALGERFDLTVEMGRFFVSECGYYLTAVADAKTNKGSRYAILDGGMHHVNYLGSNMGMRVPHILHFPGKNHAQGDPEDVMLCGSLCTTADVLVRKANLPPLAVGDVLCFTRIGAYSVTEGPALFLSRNMPRILLHTASGDVLVRDTIHTSKLNQNQFNRHAAGGITDKAL